jgi:uncharacterized protein YoxC
MIIVYLSIALVIGAIIYLSIYAVKTFKDTKPVMNRITETTARIQAKSEQITMETDKLSVTQQGIASDVQFKKNAVQETIDTVKETPQRFKQLWDTIKGKKRTRAY